MSLDERILGVIDAIYEAATEESRWHEALKQLSDFTGSQAATFWVLDGSERPRLPVFTFVNLDETAVNEYLEHTAAIDPTVRYLVRHPKEPIVHDGLVITEREKSRHPYYEWHNRRLDTRFRMVGQVNPAPMVQAGVALHRTRSAGRYEPADIDRFAVVYRQLERALAIGWRLGSLGMLQQCTAEILDRNPAGVIFLDERQCVVYANRSAEAFVSEGDGIRLSKRGMTAWLKRDQLTLRLLVGEALTAVTSPEASPGGVMRVTRPSGKAPYAVVVSPVARQYPLLAAMRPAVCVVITDPARQQTLPNQSLRALFSLTEAEARLAVLLAEGEELRAAAKKLKITYGTARARLIQIFQKTGTRRQSELMRLVLTTGTAG